MFTFLHAADIHLDSPMLKIEAYEGAPTEELRGATRRALDNLVELAVSEKVSFVVISGDLYDGDWKDYNTGLYLVSRMSRLREAGIPVFLIAGNHDAASRITKTLRLPEGVRFFPAERPDTFTLEDPPVAVHGQSFKTPAVKKDLSAHYPPPLEGRFNIGLLHTCATGREGHEPYAPCRVEDLRSKGYDYWALGHVHRREILSEDPPVVFPGNIQGRHVRETGPKGCMLVEVDDQGRANPRFRALDVARWSRLEIDAAEKDTGYDVLDALRPRMESLHEEHGDLPLVVRVEIGGRSRAHKDLASDPERWTGEVRSLALEAGRGSLFIEKVRVKTSPSIDVRSLKAASEPVAELLEYMDELGADPESLEALGGVLHDLERKIPRELKSGGDSATWSDPGRVRETLEQVRPMLLGRLTSEGSGE